MASSSLIEKWLEEDHKQGIRHGTGVWSTGGVCLHCLMLWAKENAQAAVARSALAQKGDGDG